MFVVSSCSVNYNFSSLVLACESSHAPMRANMHSVFKRDREVKRLTFPGAAVPEQDERSED